MSRDNIPIGGTDGYMKRTDTNRYICKLSTEIMQACTGDHDDLTRVCKEPKCVREEHMGDLIFETENAIAKLEVEAARAEN